ncbi:phage holin family protein [Leifsonia naganoensis]|jgi:ABC-type transport system involved in multi-copper enzyme maturation permease subunit|uniref:ABC-type transport system involved in multi-copper enzyme maturation permease subunit n=1 Tax=Leifsonia naganoensis TaxID=150025 RepID=A0A853DQ99_9MICO|nr:phage holin family protein [Leifsonia naganoensis]NYK09659.1 ABC-type transport system involved in multi-copper enzyme maturation permease subunit [Leifsonia naganoensis]
MTDRERAGSKSLVELISDLPRLLIELLKAEFAHLKAEFAAKAKYAGVGIGLFVVAAVFLFFALGVLVAAAILGLAVVLPGWASALIVFGALLVIAAVLALIGVSSLKKIQGVAPQKTIDSIKEDADALKGLGKYDH